MLGGVPVTPRILSNKLFPHTEMVGKCLIRVMNDVYYQNITNRIRTSVCGFYLLIRCFIKEKI
jgi:hypothetical protein